ncbi:MAG TPA: GntR family transcriptional regulator [Solirubrobacteraceae bacterium]|jgi:DNA-binding GntR family transcriptional regulator|nr:GntR family transcriptional regulator [Solirubrobacteraceae bacterium]
MSSRRAPSTAGGNLTKQQRVYEALRERILSGSYGPGFRVVIDAVAAEFGVSPVPVREAIRRLEAEGLVVYRPNAGAQVAPAEPGLFEQELSVLALLEGYATALAAPHLTPADLDRLRETTDLMAAAMQDMDPLAFGRRNHDFHEVVYERCPNRALVEMLRDTGRRLDAIRRTVFTHIPYRGAESIAEHRAIIDLLAAGAPAGEVETAARAHKLRTVESFRAWQQAHGSAAR